MVASFPALKSAISSLSKASKTGGGGGSDEMPASVLGIGIVASFFVLFGAAIMADPSLVAKQYQKAITGYLDDLGRVMRDAAVDYHRVNLRDPVDKILARFLIGRKPKKKK